MAENGYMAEKPSHFTVFLNNNWTLLFDLILFDELAYNVEYSSWSTG